MWPFRKPELYPKTNPKPFLNRIGLLTFKLSKHSKVFQEQRKSNKIMNFSTWREGKM